jgi:hypothetical protein
MFINTAFPLPTRSRRNGTVANAFAPPRRRGSRKNMGCCKSAGMNGYVLGPDTEQFSGMAPMLAPPVSASGLLVLPPPPPKKTGIFQSKVGNKTKGNFTASAPPNNTSAGNVGDTTEGNFVSGGASSNGQSTSGTYAAVDFYPKAGMSGYVPPRRGMGRQAWRQTPNSSAMPRLYFSQARSANGPGTRASVRKAGGFAGRRTMAGMGDAISDIMDGGSFDTSNPLSTIDTGGGSAPLTLDSPILANSNNIGAELSGSLPSPISGGYYDTSNPLSTPSLASAPTLATAGATIGTAIANLLGGSSASASALPAGYQAPFNWTPVVLGGGILLLFVAATSNNKGGRR